MKWTRKYEQRINSKEIDHEINIKNNLWNAFMVTVGGTISLMFTFDNWMKIIFIFIGFLFSAVLLNGYFKKEDSIEKLIQELRKM